MALVSIAAVLLLSAESPVPPGKVRTERTISLEVTLDAPPAEVYRLWTTADGVKRFLAPAAHIDPVVGGRYQIIFDPVSDPEGAHHGTKVGRCSGSFPTARSPSSGRCRPSAPSWAGRPFPPG